MVTDVSKILDSPEIYGPEREGTRFLLNVDKYLWNLITVQQDATYSVYYISVGSSTCFGCRQPSSGARTTVITASGIE